MHLQVYGKNKSGETLWITCGRLNNPMTAVQWAARGRKSARIEANSENYYDV